MVPYSINELQNRTTDMGTTTMAPLPESAAPLTAISSMNDAYYQDYNNFIRGFRRLGTCADPYFKFH
ncbi:hypothetical protein OK016_23450 [Vibrio chagasii]|nr:hypothetical protein [Vibrio chagasii]